MSVSISNTKTAAGGQNNRALSPDSHRAELVRRKVRKETIAAFETCDTTNSKILNSEEFERFMTLLGFFLSDMRISDSIVTQSLCNKSYELASAISKSVNVEGNNVEINTSKGKKISLFRGQVNLSALAQGVTMNGAIVFIGYVNGVEHFEHPGSEGVVRDLQKQLFVNKRSDIHYVNQVDKFNQEKHASNSNKSPSRLLKASRQTCTASSDPDERDVYKSMRWHNLLTELQEKEAENLTFHPAIGLLPPLRLHEVVKVNINELARFNYLSHRLRAKNNNDTGGVGGGGIGQVGEMEEKQYQDRSNSLYAYNMSYSQLDELDNALNPPNYSRGTIVGVYRNNRYDVRCDNNELLENVPSQCIAIITNGFQNNEHDVNTSVYDRLYLSASIQPSAMQTYSSFDKRSSVQREVDESCSFKPQMFGSNPFISDRTLRLMTENQRSENKPAGRRRSAKKPPGSPNMLATLAGVSAGNAFSDKAGQNIEIGGTLVKGFGLVKGPPAAAGMPLFYYDAEKPPNFDTGMYVELVPISANLVTASSSVNYNNNNNSNNNNNNNNSSNSNSSNISYNNNNNGGISNLELTNINININSSSNNNNNNGSSASNLDDLSSILMDTPKRPESPAPQSKIVIVKKEKPAEAEKPKSGGWQAVLEEMNAKKLAKGGVQVGMKKASEAPKTVGKLKKIKPKKVKGQKHSYADVIDELKNALNRMKNGGKGADGEDNKADDDDDEEEEEDTPRAGGRASETPAEATKIGLVGLVNEAVPNDNINVDSSSNAAVSGDSNSNAVATSLSTSSTSLIAEAVDLSKPAKPAVVSPPAPPLLEPSRVASGKFITFSDYGADNVEQKSNFSLPLQSTSSSSSTTTVVGPGLGLGTGIGVLARAATPGSIPSPPELPRSWPPVPQTMVAASNSVVQLPPVIDSSSSGAWSGNDNRQITSSLSSSSSDFNLLSFREESLELPAGYYLASPIPGLIKAGSIKLHGVTTEELIDKMNALIAKLLQENSVPKYSAEGTSRVKPFGDGNEEDDADDDLGDYEFTEGAQTQFHSEKDRINFALETKNKLSISDLPLPSDYYGAINRMKIAQKVREDRKQLEDSIEMRNYGEKPLKVSSPKNKKPVKPLHFEFNIDKRFESKDYTFRKPPDHSDPDLLPLTTHYEDKLFKATHAVNGKEHLVNASWISDLRSSEYKPNNTSTNTLVGGNRILKKSHGQITKGSDGNSTVVSEESSSFNSSFTFDENNFDNISDASLDSSIVVTKGGMVKCYRKHNTKAKGPVFSSDAQLEIRRQQKEDKMRLQEEEKNRKMEEERKIKEILRQKALDTARERGCDPTSSRTSGIDKMVAKYANSPAYINLDASSQLKMERVSQLRVAELEYKGIKPSQTRGGGGSTNSSNLYDDNRNEMNSENLRSSIRANNIGMPNFSFSPGGLFGFNDPRTPSATAIDDNAHLFFLDSPARGQREGNTNFNNSFGSNSNKNNNNNYNATSSGQEFNFLRS